MAEPTILVVDQDTALAERLAAALGQAGLHGVPLPDAAQVLSYPTEPALILLNIDPKRIGWQACSTIRRHPRLGSVPVIVTSAEATEADFDAHKKLKWRADEYLRKPLDPALVVARVRELLGGAMADDDLELSPDIEEVISVEDTGEGGEPTRVVDPDAVLADDTSSAFNSIAAETEALLDEPQTGPRGSGAVPEALPPRKGADSGPLPEPLPPPSAIAAEAPSSKRAAGDAELASLRAERDRLLDELRSRPAGGGGSAARETLAMREQVVKRDREILELREQIDAKERAILATRDQLRESERARRELDERQLSVEKELLNAQEKVEAIEQEQALSQERERSLRARTEELTRKLERVQADAEQARARLSAEVEAAMQAAERANKERDALRSEMDAAAARAQNDREALLRTHTEEKSALTGRLEETLRGNADALAALTAEHEAARQALVDEHQAAVETAEKAHLESRERTTAEAAATLAAAVKALEEKHAAASQAAAEQHAEAVAALGKQHGEEVRRLGDEATARSVEIDDLKASLAAAEAEVGRLREQAARAFQRIAGDEQITARARKAMAIALALLDESRPAVKPVEAETSGEHVAVSS